MSYLYLFFSSLLWEKGKVFQIFRPSMQELEILLLSTKMVISSTLQHLEGRYLFRRLGTERITKNWKIPTTKHKVLGLSWAEQLA